MIILDFNGKPILRAVAFDVETTGLSPELGDRVIEVGAVALKQDKIVDEFHSLVSVNVVQGALRRTARSAPPGFGRCEDCCCYLGQTSCSEEKQPSFCG
jgi:hypothetical protein